MIRLIASASILLGVLLIASCSPSEPANSISNGRDTSPASTPQPAATLDERAAGRKLYLDNCVVCHKEDGTGGRTEIEGKRINVDDLTSDKIKKFTDEKIRGYIVNGVEDEGMPAFKGRLTDGEIGRIVAYVRTGIQKISAQPAK